MELFKYCRGEHWKLMQSIGSVRIGSLRDFQRTDKYGELTSDTSEGSKRLAGTIENVNADNISSFPGLEGLIHIEGGGKVGKLVVNNYTRSVPNLLIFSASVKYSDEMHKLWLSQESYDVCYKINSARLFFRALSSALGSEFEFLGSGRVHYADEIDISTREAGIHPALVKRRTGYEGQAEIRALWQRRETRDVVPVILPNSQAHIYVSHYVTLGAGGA